jgi:hypothetical protein
MEIPRFPANSKGAAGNPKLGHPEFAKDQAVRRDHVDDICEDSGIKRGTAVPSSSEHRTADECHQ